MFDQLHTFIDKLVLLVLSVGTLVTVVLYTLRELWSLARRRW